ncbi:MAG: TlpA family protein disulfide reductase [Candidatus Electrothrix sp. AU1_5]|nr:TlpA family protein disulfide reductase [Candidatus Electrothrix gigas]MCI5194360.1 TlpA family protein disulfide reductase [Candidatus Electrothrix gigas]
MCMNSVIAKKTFVVCTVLFLLLSGNLLATPMPHFTLPSVVDGKDISSEDFKEKVLLVTFFATWCPPCLQEIPSLIRLQKDLSPKGFSVLGLSLDDGGPEIVNELVESDNINYPVLMANNEVVNGFGGVTGIPTSFLVSHEGKMIRTYTGYVSHELLRQDIEEIISKKPKRVKETTRFQVKKKTETEKKDVKTKKSVIHIDKRLRTVYSRNN